MSPSEMAEVCRQLDDYLAKGFIQPSTSPYGVPILFVQKKDGTLQICMDYRSLNKMTKKDFYPIPRIDNLLDCLTKVTIFSKIDLRRGTTRLKFTLITGLKVSSLAILDYLNGLYYLLVS